MLDKYINTLYNVIVIKKSTEVRSRKQIRRNKEMAKKNTILGEQVKIKKATLEVLCDLV